MTVEDDNKRIARIRAEVARDMPPTDFHARMTTPKHMRLDRAQAVAPEPNAKRLSDLMVDPPPPPAKPDLLALSEHRRPSGKATTAKATKAKGGNADTWYALMVVALIVAALVLFVPVSLPWDGHTCSDGWQTSSSGPGTCSWHGGEQHRERSLWDVISR